MDRRALFLGLALMLSLSWSVWTLFSAGEEVVQPTERRASAEMGPAQLNVLTLARDAAGSARAELPSKDATDPQLEFRRRSQKSSQPRNLFSSYTYEAPRPVARLPAPEAPHAPPLPFAYAGRLIVDGQATYLLLQAGAPISVTLGAQIGEFKLVQAASDRLVFLHGPTGQEVAMTLGAAAVN